MAIGGILVRDDNGEDVDEVRFGDGSKAEKRYHVELISKVLTECCGELTGKISVIGKDGKAITVPGKQGEYYLSEYQLVFELSDGKCKVGLRDETAEGVKKDKFVLSNLSKEALKDRPFDPDTVAVVYGGIGNKLIIEINDAKGEIPIEPLGIILVGIDGLRQDVLYSPSERQVNEPGANYYVYPEDLSGLCEVMGGKYEFNDLSGNFECKIAGWENRHIKLQNVSTIFPSITYAAWASIFTGEEPSKTGITASEFFARDLCDSATNPIPGMAEVGIPPGMVSLDAGAFQPGKGFKWIGYKDAEFILSHVIPAEFSLAGSTASGTLSGKIKNSAPLKALQVNPFFEEIGEKVREKYSISPNRDMRCDQTEYECRTVTMYSQYGKGADWWGTPSKSLANAFDYIVSFLDSAKIMDEAPVNDAKSFISNYFLKKNIDGKRKRFPAVFSIYFSGLDHYAHAEGMRGYSTFFRSTTDPQIKDFVDALKKQGEFDNKIFIVVADHGMTAMPDFESIILPSGEIIEPDTSCKLRIDNFDDALVQLIEKENNNLHIWELADLFTTFVPTEAGIKLLAPPGLNNTGLNIIQNPGEANVVAALNGPMAHIYVKGEDWKSNPDEKRLGTVIDAFIRVLTLGENASDKVKKEFTRLNASVHKILVRLKLNGPYEVVTGVAEDALGNVVINTASLATSENQDYVNVVSRIARMNNPDRSGDIVLIMKDSMADINQRFTTGVSCKSWHGSLNKSDSYVPLTLAYPGGNRFELGAILNIVCANNSCDGNWKLGELFKEIIKAQYSGQ
jgi:hypothetical protein